MEERGREKGDARYKERNRFDVRHGYTPGAHHRELRRCDEQTPVRHQGAIRAASGRHQAPTILTLISPIRLP
jgi:hypothetical protein